MESGPLGRSYRDGETIVRQGDTGDCMYVIQAGQVEVVRQEAGGEVRLAILDEGDFFGEMALVERQVRSATVRSMGDSQVLTVDRKVFLRRVHEDPSFAFRILEKMCRRVRELNEQLVKTRGAS